MLTLVGALDHVGFAFTSLQVIVVRLSAFLLPSLTRVTTLHVPGALASGHAKLQRLPLNEPVHAPVWLTSEIVNTSGGASGSVGAVLKPIVAGASFPAWVVGALFTGGWLVTVIVIV